VTRANPSSGNDSAKENAGNDDNIYDGRETLLLPGAVIVYEYIFTDETVTNGERAPVFFTGKGLSDFGDAFKGWQVADFSPHRILLRRSIDRSAKNYIIGIYGGFVAVFYDCGAETYELLKLVTDKPVSALGAGERERLANGLRVYGDDMLVGVLQDYDS
jgi:hypothetical protein